MPLLPVFEIDWIDQPDVSDLLERRTWAALRISVGNRYVTRAFDESIQAERNVIFVPLFGLIRWVVKNWWFLLYESSYAEGLPELSYPVSAHERAWIARHSFRSADTGLVLPALYIYSSGPTVSVHWAQDPLIGFPHMPLRFESVGHVNTDRMLIELALENLVDAVLKRCSGLESQELQSVEQEWDAIKRTSPDEADFCSAAARMGLDCYSPDQLPGKLVDLLEKYASDVDTSPVVRDFFESTDPKEAPGAWQLISSEIERMELQPGGSVAEPDFGEMPAFKFGYQAARKLRRSIGFSDGQPIGSMKHFARQIEMGGLSFVNDEGLSFKRIKAITGQRKNKTLVVAGPRPPLKGDVRFLEARAIYHSLHSANNPRLITDAVTQEQQASRAFAAELLAPAAGLIQYSESHSNLSRTQLIDRLANKYDVSSRAVHWQLNNANINGL